jgi:FkbM family methyltransferase
VLAAKQLGAAGSIGRFLQACADRRSGAAIWDRHTARRLAAACARQQTEIDLPGLPGPVHLRANSTDHAAFRHIFLQGAYDVRLPSESVRTVVDGGANAGFATLYFARRYPEARIVAIEPEEGNCRQLRENARLLPRITVMRAALWSGRARLRIENPQAANWSFRVGAGAAPPEGGVEAYGMTDIMTEMRIERIDILKLDVEGAEKDIFESACDGWLARTRLVICELHDRHKAGAGAAFHAAMARNGFRVVYNGENAIGINGGWERAE